MVGKGGAGKTALSALLVRAFRNTGRQVVAMDLDRNPGLAVSLGLRIYDLPLPPEAVQEKPEMPYGWAMADGLSADEAMRRYALAVEPGLRFLGVGNISRADHGLARFWTAVRQVWDGFDDRDWVAVADMEAGPTTTFEGYVRSVDVALVVTRPAPISMLAARRLVTILEADGTPFRVVATAVRDAADLELVSDALGAPFAAIPFDPELRRLERLGPLVELPPSSPARVAAAALVERLVGVSAASSRVPGVEAQLLREARA
ncbi:MAG: P-loop NTPase [Candidatus Dormibacteria bacterium]